MSHSLFGSSTSQHNLIAGWALADGMSGVKIHDKLVVLFGDNALSLRTVQQWSSDVKDGRTEMGDMPRSGRPRSSRSHDNVNLMQSLLDEDNTITTRTLCDKLGISMHVVMDILHADLGLSKLSCRWVPRLLSDAHKIKRAECS